MRGITRDEVTDLTAYERMRPEYRRQIIDLKSRRRLQVGSKISIVFENRRTVLYQIQEMIRAERMVENRAIDHEIETYNELLPGPGRLAGTLFIELTDREKIREELEGYLGLDRGEHIWFDLGDAGRAYACFAQGQSDEVRISSVHYVEFVFAPDQIAAFKDPAWPLEIVIEHPNIKVRQAVPESTRRELALDFDEA